MVLIWWLVAILVTVISCFLIRLGFLTGCVLFSASILLYIIAFTQSIIYIAEIWK